MQSRTHTGAASHLMRLALAIGFAVALLAFPRNAYADSYSIDEVIIDATVATDGSVSVKESRTFDFDGSYRGVYWKIPTGDYDGRTIETTIDSVGEMVDGVYVPFTEGSSGLDHTYEISDYDSYIRVKLYSAHSSENATFVINYTDSNLAARHDDVAVLYWKFVSDGWDVESENVTCTVHLPVPAGRTITPGEDVRAWGHGPLDASVGFDGNDVVYQVPGVGTSEFAEARITFPESWLSEATSLGGTVLPSILEEEQQWADEANEKRQSARRLLFGGYGTAGLLTLLTLVLPFTLLARYRRTHKATFDDEYFRDVPTDDHPAVLGMVYHGGKVKDTSFTATLMRLTDLDAIKLELTTFTEKGLFGNEKTKKDYRLSKTAKLATMELDQIDKGAVSTLFSKIGAKSTKHKGDTSKTQSILFSDIEAVAKAHPGSFRAAYDGWKGTVEAEAAKRRLFRSSRSTGMGWVILCAVVSGLLPFLTFVLTSITGAWSIGMPLMALQAGVFASNCVIATRLKDISDEAIEIKAKLEALRRWLTDFTRLPEAVPRDVVLWNRLLVMAVVLGVAGEVIRQLKVAVPELLNEPDLMPTYGWYYHSASLGRAHELFSSTYAHAHSVSTMELSSSSFSSGSGSGGGFSSGGGGGGGGFGGGGGGGAF